VALTLERPQPSTRALVTTVRTRGDALWLLGAAGVLMVLCALPYLVSAWSGPADLERLGTFWFARDFSQYQAAMREGAQQSGWLVHDHFSAEGHQPAFVYPLYTGMGKLAALLHQNPLLVFSAAEWLGRLALLAALYVFAATFVEDRRARQLAVALAAVSLGLSGLVAPLRALLEAVGATAAAAMLPNTINVHLELSSFGVFLSAPHLMFGLALTLVCGVLYLKRSLVLLGLAVLGLSLMHPFNLPVLLSVLAVHAAWSGRHWWPGAAIALAAGAPILAYDFVLFTFDPFWSGTYGTQNLMPAPTPWALPVDLGIVLLAAPLAWPVVKTWPSEQRRLLLLWVGLALVWLYVPVPYQRRFAFGVHPALCVVGAVGLLRLHARVHRRLVNYVLAVAITATPVLVYVALIGSAESNFPSEVYLWSRAEAEAAAWIGAHSSANDVVLASTEFSNPLAGAIDGRVVHGHIVATLHSRGKQMLLSQFFAANATPAQRSEALAASGATLVAFGPRERDLGVSDLSGQPELDLQYDRGGVQVFRVRR
jgi:hypothetical protein